MKRNNKTRIIKIRATDEWCNALETALSGSMFSSINKLDASKAIRLLTMEALLKKCDPSHIEMIQDQIEANNIYKSKTKIRA